MATSREETVEEFDSSDEESKTAEDENNRLEDNANKFNLVVSSSPSKYVPPALKDSNTKSSSSKAPNVCQTNDNYIPLKIDEAPSVDEDNMEVTLVCKQDYADKSIVQDENSSTRRDSGDLKHNDSFEPKEDVEGDEDIEDEFGLDRESITHQQLMELTSKGIASLIESDPLLADLPSDITLEEINSQIALVQGQSISVMVAASQPAKLVVAQEGTVLDLKRSLQRHTALRLARQGRSKVKVNWRSFWRTHWLVQPGGNRLVRDSDKLKDLGIVNRSVLTYCKRLNERQR